MRCRLSAKTTKLIIDLYRVIRVPARARVSRVSRVCPGSRAPPGVFLPALFLTTGTGTLLSRPRGAVDSGLAAVLAAVESVAVFVWVCVVGFGWMVVRLVRVICVPARARVSRVSRVCSGSPRCLFTGTGTMRDLKLT